MAQTDHDRFARTSKRLLVTRLRMRQIDRQYRASKIHGRGWTKTNCRSISTFATCLQAGPHLRSGSLPTKPAAKQPSCRHGKPFVTPAEIIDDKNQELTCKPMRVAFYLFFAGSGIGRYTHELLNTLSRSSNISTELICLPSFHWRSEAHYAIWPGLYEIAHRNPLKRKSRFLTAQIANPKRLAQRASETRSNRIHLSNINHLTFPLWKKTLRRFGSKVVATVHDVRREKGIINHRYELNQLQRFYRWADALFVHSKAQADDLKSFANVMVQMN